VGVGEIPAHHDEVSTLNQALFATFDYNWASGWDVSAIVPVVKREHEHIHNHIGEAIPKEWNFTALGDIRVASRYQLPVGTIDPAKAQTVGLIFGVKLPSGKRRDLGPVSPLNQCAAPLNQRVVARVRHQKGRRWAAKPLLHESANAAPWSPPARDRTRGGL
jgi:hypothetical protein